MKMKRNMKDWMNDLLNSTERKALPILSFPGAELIGTDVFHVVSDAEMQYKCIKAISEKYPSIVNVTPMDLSVEAEAFGCEIKFTENEVPTVIKGVISDIDEAENLSIPNVGDKRTSVYLKAAELAAENIKERPTFAGMIGPFSLAGRLFDMTEIMVAIMTEEEKSHILLKKCTQFLVEYAKAFKNAGANGIIIAEPAAGLLSPQHCQEFSSQYVKQIIDEVQDDFFMVILHNCGNTVNLVESLLSTGAKGFHFGNAVDMGKILPQIPSERIAMGNVDPASVLKNGSVDDVREKSKELLLKQRLIRTMYFQVDVIYLPELRKKIFRHFLMHLMNLTKQRDD